ncbi:hypothetical protein JY651_42745 [Pyxidicoccus parkwayensis]|uniref:cGAS/DncV-like nucleotidyltransferase C-terminal helical domain-containing protein n=1 Tax=Pyxidicoccus parkwayensis TaxID=2813578 RepID=A0ABX7NWF9_9BACT|nr:hypothetical protein [Pyxidicoccus parkwaysis]QSQ21802.1 hypothetical protein JY651_42745 [Pyxidicoccus parkwaysis]
MRHALDNEFVLNYARPPADAVRSQAIQHHQQVRARLGDTDYVTFLQGSYSNDTALADMNDVDIVAVRRGMGGTGSAPLSAEQWSTLFRAVGDKLAPLGPWKQEDKCIRLNTPGVRVDIVPAISLGNTPAEDPITIYSFRTGRQKKNWPHGHQARGRQKSDATHGHYKQAVRLFKYWKACCFGSRKVAPSYYLESLLYSLPNELYAGDLATNFVTLAGEIGRRYPSAHGSLSRIAGEGNLLSPDEWGADAFREFLGRLAIARADAERALREIDSERARSAWRAAFNGR